MAQKIPLNIKSPQRIKPYTRPVWIIRMFILLRNVQAYAEPLWQASGLARRNDGASGWLPENRQEYTPSIAVHQPKMILGFTMALLGGQAEPFESLIISNTYAIAKFHLGEVIPLAGRSPIPFQAFFAAFWNAGSLLINFSQPILSPGMPL